MAVILSLTGLPHLVHADKTKSALRAVEKGELEKAEEIVKKSLEKESVNPGAKYVYSVLYALDSFPRYNLDSAHWYIISSQKDFELSDEKEIENLAKDDVTEKDLSFQHLWVDSTAFALATKLNTLAVYNYFIEQYSHSAQYDLALRQRNSLAFHHASSEHSWQSYKSFIDHYPSADQFQLATEQYNRLIFEEKTKHGGLKEIEEFLVEHPDTPYKDILVKRIFSFISIYGEEERLIDFVQTYDHPSLQRRALDILYYLAENKKGYEELLNGSKWKNYRDSLEQITTLNQLRLIPFYENESYGFADFDGSMILDYSLKYISPTYYCGNVKDRLIEVGEWGKYKLVNRALEEVHAEEIDFHRELDFGIVEIGKNGISGAIHQSGFEILPKEFEEVSVLNRHFLKTKKEGKYGLRSILGQKFLEEEYDNIELEKDFVIFEKNQKISIYKMAQLSEYAKSERFEPKFIYEDYEFIEDKLICFDGDKEVMFDKNLEVILPLADQRINTRFETWVVKREYGYQIFDKNVGSVRTEVYSRLIQNDEWLAVTVDGESWSVFSKSLTDVPIVGLDSVSLLGNDIALVFRGSNGMAIFPNKKIVEFQHGELLRSISAGTENSAHLLVIERNGKNVLFRDGEQILESSYEIGYISEDVLSAKSKGEYGAMDMKGRLIMRIRYDAIGRAENGISPVLYNGRFGAFNFNNRTLINLKFDEKIKPYNDHLLITHSRGVKGLYNVKNETVIDPQFDELVYWTDSVALVKKESFWTLKSIYNDEFQLSEIQNLEFLSKSPDEIVIKYRTDKGLGIYSSKSGSVVEAAFNEIFNLGTLEKPLYFCEKYVKEADYYVVVYKTASGETIRTHAYPEEEYEAIVCD